MSETEKQEPKLKKHRVYEMVELLDLANEKNLNVLISDIKIWIKYVQEMKVVLDETGNTFDKKLFPFIWIDNGKANKVSMDETDNENLYFLYKDLEQKKVLFLRVRSNEYHENGEVSSSFLEGNKYHRYKTIPKNDLLEPSVKNLKRLKDQIKTIIKKQLKKEQNGSNNNL